jgi:outer membrane lipoprotein LolB
VTRGGAPPRPSHSPASSPRRCRHAASLLVLITAAWLAVACTTVPPARSDQASDFSGRLALRVEPIGGEAPRALSAAFDLRGDAQAGTLGLSTPLGSLLAQARWSPSEVVLTTPRETRRFDSLDAMTREALGESVPIEAWFDWLRGRPWPGAPSAVDAAGAGFRQLGWRVDLAQFGDGTIAATRESPAPVVRVRIRLDRA